MTNATATSQPSEGSCPQNTLITQQIIPGLYFVVFVAGVLLNGVSGWVFLSVPSSKSFIVYLKNIVVADFLMSLTFPFKILGDSGLGPWQLNVFVCRVSAVLFYINMYVSIMFFGLIAFDRYYKIVKPLLTSFIQSVNNSKLLSVLVWVLTLLLAVPNMILTNQSVKEVTRIKCVDLKNELGLKWHKASNYIFIGIFWIVFLSLIIFYTAITRKIFKSHLKSKKNSVSVKKKSSRNIFSIMLVFFVCFVPYHVARVPYTRSQTETHFSCQSKEILLYVKEFSLLLSAANICLDPIIYFFLCQPFREILCKKLHIPLKVQHDSETSKTRRGNITQESTDTL
ncbi:LOW QUALITY PROTEIN: P2Y purinoceptor 14 [Camelus ferus]|uniref:LOW QUALITY PROTEIN: P2Y purinoceptor 14 n=1 Tax=Camelus ferus TaxID=419612 RepID=A0A8B8TKB5_CAMFR|nr:LOW QUALITY PROTEIN: P2Y purinoceptor 14 [Camelus ferus]